jgi:hypothetical protein
VTISSRLLQLPARLFLVGALGLTVCFVASRLSAPSPVEGIPAPTHFSLARELAGLITLRAEPGSSVSARQLLALASRLIENHANAATRSGLPPETPPDPRTLNRARTVLAAEPALRRSLDDLLAQGGFPLTQTLLDPVGSAPVPD